MRNETERSIFLCKCLLQIENEYGPMEYEIGAPGQAYTKWAARMAVGLGTGVPWVMCKQDDAPDPIVSAAKLSFYLFLSTFTKFTLDGLHVMFAHHWWGCYLTVCCPHG